MFYENLCASFHDYKDLLFSSIRALCYEFTPEILLYFSLSLLIFPLFILFSLMPIILAKSQFVWCNWIVGLCKQISQMFVLLTRDNVGNKRDLRDTCEARLENIFSLSSSVCALFNLVLGFLATSCPRHLTV